MNRKWVLGVAGVVLIALVLLRRIPDEGTRRDPILAPADIDFSYATPEETDPAGPADSGETSPPKENPVAPVAPAQDYAGQRAAFLDKLEPLFGSREKGRGVLYSMVVESLDKESVPLLRELLQDDLYKDRWSQIAMMIAWLSDRDDEESVSAILSYIRRPSTWAADDRDSILKHTIGKGGVLKYLGLFESELVKETLQDAFTEEGAEELISAWINVQTTVEPIYLVMIIRSWAAKGLVLSRDPENIVVVSESYEALAHKMLSAEYREKEMTAELWLDSERHLAFCEGMADNEMLKDMGVEDFLRLRDDGHSFGMRKIQYGSKYMGERLDDERIIMHKCPLCGKVAE